MEESRRAKKLLRRCWDRLRKRRGSVAFTIFLVAHLAGAFSSVRAIMETRTSQGTIAWVISLNTVPYAAVPAYWILGRSKFEGYVTARRGADEKVTERGRRYLGLLEERGLMAQPERDEVLIIEKLAKLPFTSGNNAELLVDGEETFDSILAGIERAEDYIFVQFYILRDDGIGQELRKRLVARAKEGVKVKVLYDEIGSGNLMKGYAKELLEAGAEVAPFNSTKGSTNRFQLNFRNHRKIVVVDGAEAWVGGHNVGDEYLGKDPKFGDWRDTHLRLEGPVVEGAMIAFAEDWHWATGQVLDFELDPRPAPGGFSMDMLCLPTGPDDPLESCALYFLHLIAEAENRLWIASPYFVPDEQFISALQLAALRGVDVRIIVPEQSDNELVELAAWSYVEELERVGVRFHRHGKGFMHQKVILVDEDLATVGTVNFDNRSFRLNFEITIAVQDAAFNAEVAAMLERDLADSRPVEAREVQEMGFWHRFAIRASRLLGPVL